MAELLVATGSKVDAETLAVFVIVAPAAAVTFSVSVMAMWLPVGTLGIVHVTVPVPPTGGAVQVPPLVVTLLNVVPVGVASLTTTVQPDQARCSWR